jgi:hypothetical protein
MQQQELVIIGGAEPIKKRKKWEEWERIMQIILAFCLVGKIWFDNMIDDSSMDLLII